MRLGLVLLLISLPGAALAAEDRYGPSRTPVTTAAVIPMSNSAPSYREPAGYRGQTLSWAGKATAPAPPQAAPAAPPQAAPRPVSGPPVMASRAPPPARLPTSLYDAPAPAQVTAPPPVLQPPASQPPAAQPLAAAWPRTAPAEPALPPPPTPPPLAGTPSYGYSAPRSYSVVREWGGTPDRIPTPPSAAQFSGREVALDPNTLGSGQPADQSADEEVNEEDAQQQRDAQQKNQAAKGKRK